MLGPLGHGFPVDAVESGETALLVGGGIGVPPLYQLSKMLVAKGVKVIHVLGFATKAAVFYENEFAQLGETYITTEDGSYGTKGFVTDVMKDLTNYQAIYSCGPTPMLKALETGYSDHKLYLSLGGKNGLWYWSLLRLCMSYKVMRERLIKKYVVTDLFSALER